MRNWLLSIVLALCGAGAAQPSVTLLLEEPYGTFGGMNPTGHAAVYLSHVCAASPLQLRKCEAGEAGVVISRYDRIDGYDWIAIPLLPYLYAVDRPDQVPEEASPADVAELRDAWRRANLEALVSDQQAAAAPKGDWTQLVGSAYDRKIYAFGMETTEAQDDAFIRMLNSRRNKRRFNLFFHNCADFARHAIDFYYPHAVHRSLFADVGVTTPKQDAHSLVSYAKKHRDVRLSAFVIPQVPGTMPRSSPVRGVLESLVKSKRYALPLVSAAAVYPLFTPSLAFAWIEGERFNPKRAAAPEDAELPPATIIGELESNGLRPGSAGTN